jgi:ATP-binding cassette, subfamily B, bacterial PglK
MVFEIFGLGILLPIISMLLDKDYLKSNYYLNELFGHFNYIPENDFLVYILFFLIIIYSIKSLFLIYLSYRQNRFLSNITAYISNSLFNNYLNQSYSFFINDNTSRLSKNIQLEVNYFSIFLKSMITLIVEGGLVLSILITLIIIEPLGATVIGLLFGFLALIFIQFTKKRLIYLGDFRQQLDSKSAKIVLETFEGIKTIKIKNIANYYVDIFKKISYDKAKINSNQLTLSQLPRYYFELVSIFCLLGFIIVMISMGKDSTSLLATLGIFVAAVFRVMPSLNRIIVSLQSLKFHNSSVEVIYKELSSYEEQIDEAEKPFIFSEKISIDNIQFNYGKKNILKDVSLGIKKNETIGIVGESGSGKSTLIDLIIGIQQTTKGLILVDGVNIHSNIKGWFSKIGYVNQDVFLMDDSIINNIALGIPTTQISKQRIHDVIEQTQLKNFIEGLDKGLETKVGDKGIQLSGGQKQRLGIARALYKNPEILIFDEATSALDLSTESNILDTIKKLKNDKTVIIISHRPNTLDFCDVIYEVNNSKCKKILSHV